ncbi:RIP metalloprotease RseP [Candidatus Uhrbacteria bacterium RIFCSPHIGHO2_01_FULL_63_20]|uniref:Zinc metalloprotease n=1 Tax=Candidatus Uhrbacteria bacterium RIFCSPHIGHO2_01_FULL_63_20 TaxID=1802385 RepID=A0A1F7TLL7_9BACT|nr:MAG: RIP metalloprotease RseP [Candidatus Uhrbacteria bacterium RIFCSPHIGHO2_01_FULL_63_20]
MLSTILLFIVVLAVLVLAHEFGHFIMAKKAGMAVEEFGFGFPPRLWGWRRGVTTYSVNLIPLGGFVKIKGESGLWRDHSDSFAAKSGAWRFAVLAAGVVMNLVLAAILLTAGFTMGLPSMIDENISPSATVREAELRIVTVAPGSPAERAGIKGGDALVSVDGQAFADADDARAYIALHGDDEVMMVMGREDGTFYNVTAKSEDIASVGVHGIGVGIVKTGLVSYPLHLAFVHGVLATGEYTKEVVGAFVGLVRNLIVEQRAGVDLSGPVGIAVLTGEAASLGFVHLLQFTALLSINLAVVNVLPLPALDGGRLALLLIEKARGRSLDGRSEAILHNIGFALLMTLVVFITYKDVVRMIGQGF